MEPTRHECLDESPFRADHGNGGIFEASAAQVLFELSLQGPAVG